MADTGKGKGKFEKTRRIDPGLFVKMRTGKRHKFKINVEKCYLKDVKATYEKLKSETSELAARSFLCALDGAALEKMARRGVALEGEGEALKRTVKDAKDDPNLLDERVRLLWGMQNERIKQTQDYLQKQDFECPQHGIYDDVTVELCQLHLEGLGYGKG